MDIFEIVVMCREGFESLTTDGVQEKRFFWKLYMTLDSPAL